MKKNNILAEEITLETVENLIARRVPRRVVLETFYGIWYENQSLHDAFNYAACHYAKTGTELYKAWYNSDFRRFIPSAYCAQFLDFSKYPLKYQ